MIDKNTKILLVDDHQLILSGLQLFLNNQLKIEQIQTANNGKIALKIIESSEIDLLISDVSMPEMDGIELARRVKNDFPHIKIITITQFNDIQILKPLLKAGVDAILFKARQHEEIKLAIETVLNGKKYYTPELNALIIADIQKVENKSGKKLVKLSKREKQVLSLIAEEKTNKEIADSLFISIPTVETYRRNLFRKFEVKNSVGLIRKAMQLGFID